MGGVHLLGPLIDKHVEGKTEGNRTEEEMGLIPPHPGLGNGQSEPLCSALKIPLLPPQGHSECGSLEAGICSAGAPSPASLGSVFRSEGDT